MSEQPSCARCNSKVYMNRDNKIIRGNGAMTILHSACFDRAMMDDRDPLIIVFCRDFSYEA